MTSSIFITGGSSGLGKEVALGFAAQGYRVFAGVRKIEDANPLMVNGNIVVPVVFDLRNQHQIAEVVKDIDLQCGSEGLSILVNMAGYSFVSPFEFTEQQIARDLFDVLFFGPAALTKALLPTLKRCSVTKGRRPKVINIISWAAIDASPFVGFYSSAKAAFLRLSESQFYEFKSIGIDSVAILPGVMKTPFVVKMEINKSIAHLSEEGKLAYNASLSQMAAMANLAQTSSIIPKPAVIAKRILKIASLEKPRSYYLIGKDTRLINLFNKVVPLCLLEALKMKLFKIKMNGTPDKLY
jgi:NAD(P)-dependent dehydrogenase (short-subunit alcohol dehydrogenase family)